MRWYGCIGLLVATSAWAQYAASDDGRIVYFSSQPLAVNGITLGSRLWTWSEGSPRLVFDPSLESNVALAALSTDGQVVLARLGGGRWRVFRHGAPAPLLDINNAEAVSMSRNGRWLAIARSASAPSTTRLELLFDGTRPAGVLPGYPSRQPNLLEVFDDGLTTFACAIEATCAWDGSTLTELPGIIGSGYGSRFLYYWSNPGLYGSDVQFLQQYDRVERKTVQLQSQCQKRVQNFYSPSGHLLMTYKYPQSGIKTSDRSGTQVLATCQGNSLLVDTTTATTVAIPNAAILNSSFTRILSRPTPSTFAWAPLGTALPSLESSDSVSLNGSPVPGGILTTVGDPDFQINWGGQTLPWLKGAYGYSYAPLPADLVPSATDFVAITSATRPWLNTSVRQMVQSNTPIVLPLVAADPRIAFIHGDYRGFLTPGSYAARGDYLHFLISGVDPTRVTPSSTIEISYNDPAPGLRPPIRHSFPLVALSPTPYHPNISQVTFRIPDDARSISSANYAVTCTFEVTTPDGRTTRVQLYGYLVYDRPAFPSAIR
jgi:hypothetical protein